MTFRVIIEAEAERELAEAVIFYDERELGLGQRFAREVREVFRKVSDDPTRYPSASRRTRKAVMPSPWPYSIYYAVKSETSEIVISSVWHGSRNPSKLRRRLR
jgi:plasmid stabilization system protein ParE